MRLLAVSGSRADWGYLVKPLETMRADPAMDVRLAVTGQHLDAASGGTLSMIRAAGFDDIEIVDPVLSGDSAVETTGAMARILSGMAGVIARVKPDMMFLLGDRYETLAAASAAMMARIPIAHLCGGDVSEGAVDDAIRHAVSKLSHLHFPSNGISAQRLIQMGEDPGRVHMVGSTSLDLLLSVPIMARAAFLAEVGLADARAVVLVTMHPVTLAEDPAAEARALVSALAGLDESHALLISGTNADTGRLGITRMLENLVARRSNAVLVPSLGNALFVNALAHCSVMVGNSSSGLYEAPSMGIPTVNVGTRQDGRLKAASVADCPAEPAAILAAMADALAGGRKMVSNPYGDGKASQRIAALIKAHAADPARLLHKRFRATWEDA